MVSCGQAPHCKRRDGGRSATWLIKLHETTAARQSTTVAIYADKTRLKRFLQLVRGFKPVDLTRPVVQLTDFVNADRTVSCHLSDRPADIEYGTGPERQAFCITGSPEQLGVVKYDGTVTLCQHDVPFPCVDQWTGAGQPLSVGQRSDFGGFSCAVETSDVTCTVTSGAGTGRGFRVGPGGISAAPAAAAARTPDAPAQVSAGDGYTCALLAPRGNVACWGAGTVGQLGDGTSTATASPIAVAGISGAERSAPAGTGRAPCWRTGTSTAGVTPRSSCPVTG